MIDKISGVIIGVSVVLILLFSSILFWSTNTKFHEKQFLENNSAEVIKISESDLHNANQTIIDYITKKRDDIVYIAKSYDDNPFFNNRETMHMKDVKELFNFGYNITIFAIIVLFIIILFGIKNYSLRKYFKLSNVVVCSVVVIFNLGAILMYKSFDKYFTLFHKTFFDNDLWILNPNSDMMINMYTKEFFINISTNIFITYNILLLMYICIVFYFDKIFNFTTNLFTKTKS